MQYICRHITNEIKCDILHIKFTTSLILHIFYSVNYHQTICDRLICTHGNPSTRMVTDH